MAHASPVDSSTTNATTITTTSNESQNPEQNQPSDKFQDGSASTNTNDSQNLNPQPTEKERQHATRVGEQDRQSFILQKLRSLKNWASPYIWNSNNTLGMLYTLEHIGFLSPLPPDAWAFLAEQWQWTPVVTWFCGIIVLQRLFCCRKAKSQLSGDNLQDKVRPLV